MAQRRQEERGPDPEVEELSAEVEELLNQLDQFLPAQNDSEGKDEPLAEDSASLSIAYDRSVLSFCFLCQVIYVLHRVS